MGLKFKKLNIATNENNILDRTLRSGDHSIKGVVSTTSPSIDIQISSNFERLVYDSCKDPQYIQDIMNSLKKEGLFNLSEKCRLYINKYFSSDTATENEVKDIMLQYYVDHDITLDPHTAVGVSCGKNNLPLMIY